MKQRTHAGLMLCLGLCVLLGLLSASATGPNSTGAASALAGQSATLLPDGQWLLVGGDGPGDPQPIMGIRDPRTGVTTPLATRLAHPRAWHTATLLPDGRILILGGIGIDGTMPLAELFDPETQRLETLPSTGLTPRAHHTATLLTDGQVLIAGGLSAGGDSLAQAELWDPRAQAGRAVTGLLATARHGHSAALLPSGAVLLWGGINEHDGILNDGEVYDQDAQRFSPVVTPPSVPEADPPHLEASLPHDSAEDVPVDMKIALRFSGALRVETVNTATVRLAGPLGEEAVRVVPAEGGMLAFVLPGVPLKTSARYTVVLHGLLDSGGVALPVTVLSFKTAGEDAQVPPAADAPSSPASSGPSSPLERPGEQRADEAGEEWTPVPGSWKTGRPPSPWQSLPPLQAPAGVTALAGQVLMLSGEPLANTTLRIESRSVKTDDTGRFLLTSIPSGHHELLIDGRTANRLRRTYGLFEVGLGIKPRQTNVLPYTVWMPRLDTAHAVTIPSPTTAEVVVTTPRIPGLELRIPPRTVIRDREGTVVTSISLTPVPLDRPPFPLARNVRVPVYFTAQPGGAYVAGSAGIRVVYPNRLEMPPGARLNFWRYQTSDVGWSIYGLGTVTGNGKQVTPNPGVAIYELAPAMLDPDNVPPPDEGLLPPGMDSTLGTDPPVGGDPVDLATGLFVLTRTDLSLPDVVPIILTRTYRQHDPNPRPFGIGSSHPYEMFLWSGNTAYQDADLVLANGARVHYVRTSSGTGFADAVFEHTTTASRFLHSQIVWNGDGWTLTLKDGNILFFGENAPLQALRDRHGNTVTLQRSNGQSGNITTILSPNGRWLTFLYDSGNRIIQATDNIGRTVAYSYDTSGRLATARDPSGGLTEYTYDDTTPADPIKKTRMVTQKDARGIVFLTNAYDVNGRVIQQTQADQTVFQFAYTLSAGKVTRTDVTDPRGFIRRVTFNSAGYALTDTQAFSKAEAQVTTYVRQAGTHLPLTRTDPLSRQTTFTYDPTGNVKTITRAAGTPQAVTSTFTYEPMFNQLASFTDPLSHTTTLDYDALGNLTAITNPLGHPTTFTYNAAGQPLTVRDPLGNTTEYTYESGDLVAVINPLGQVTRRYLDGAGRPAILRNALGHENTYTYDAVNRLTRVIDAQGGETSFTYDANGNVLSVTDARRGPSNTYIYDAMDRATRRTDPLLHAQTRTYDAAGNVLTFTSRKNQVTTSIYDGLNRRTKATYADSSTTTYTRDKGKRLTRAVDSAGGTLTRTYDTLDRITKETTPQGAVTYTYDAAGRRKTMTVTGQPAVSYDYDNANRLTRITKGTSIVSMAYDIAGRRTSLTLPNAIVTEYTYDAASRLTRLTYKKGAAVLGDLTHAYDAVGHRTQVAGSFARTALPQPVGGATYNAGNQQTTFGSHTLTYDLNGNVTSDGVRTYAWNARSQLAGITAPGLGVTFRYDGLGRRIGKTVGGTATNFVYDGLTSIQQTGATTVNLLTGLGIDEYFMRTDAAGPRTLLTDALGSTLALTDSAGTMQTQYTYDPFGNTTSSGPASTNPLQYTGRENDGTGLYYYRARYYQPGLHRFISEDRAARAGANPYTYVGNSPLDAIDPSGLLTIVIYGSSASSGPGGASASSGNNPGLNNLVAGLRDREPVEILNSGQVQHAIDLALRAQAAGDPVYVVGHSMGGSAAIDAAMGLKEPPTHLYTIDPFLPNQNIPDNIPTTNFLQRDTLPFGSYLQGQNVENVLIEGLGLLGHFTITEQVREAITQDILSGRKP